jgi:hypothetical protein
LRYIDVTARISISHSRIYLKITFPESKEKTVAELNEFLSGTVFTQSVGEYVNHLASVNRSLLQNVISSSFGLPPRKPLKVTVDVKAEMGWANDGIRDKVGHYS